MIAANMSYIARGGGMVLEVAAAFTYGLSSIAIEQSGARAYQTRNSFMTRRGKANLS